MIKDKLRNSIAKDKLDKVLHVLGNIIIDKEFSDNVLLLTRQFEEIKREHMLGIIFQNELSVKRNQVVNNINKILGKIPDDIEIIRNKIYYYIQNKEDVKEAINFTKNLVDGTANYLIRPFEKEFARINNENLNENDYETTEGELEKWQVENATLGHQLIDLIDQKDKFLFPRELSDELWEILQKERNSAFIEITFNNKLSDGETSKYYEDIILKEGLVRTKLLLWQEEYLTGNFDEAIKYCNKVRLELNEGTSLIYEYLMLSFLKKYSPDLIIRKAFSNSDNYLFKKIMLYIERSKFLGGVSSTRENSLLECHEHLIKSIKKIYQNIQHDYVTERATRGISKRRELIKQSINTTILLKDKFEFIPESFTEFYEDLIIELEGGGKYDWIYERNGNLKNKTTYNAVEIREKILKIINPENKPQKKEELGSYLIENLTSKSKNIFKARFPKRAKEKLILSCNLGFFLYGNREFLNLKKKVYYSEDELFEEDSSFENSEQKPELVDEDIKDAYEDAIKDFKKEEIEKTERGDDENKNLKNEISAKKYNKNLFGRILFLFDSFLLDFKRASLRSQISFVLAVLFWFYTIIYGGFKSGIIFSLFVFLFVMIVILVVYNYLIQKRPVANIALPQ